MRWGAIALIDRVAIATPALRSHSRIVEPLPTPRRIRSSAVQEDERPILRRRCDRLPAGRGIREGTEIGRSFADKQAIVLADAAAFTELL
jgi:hypothetical protein